MFNTLQEEITSLSDFELESISLKETVGIEEALCEMYISPISGGESTNDVCGDMTPESNSISKMMQDFTSTHGVWSNDKGSDRAYLADFSDEELNNLSPDSKTKYTGSLVEQLLGESVDPSDDEDEEFTLGSNTEEECCEDEEEEVGDYNDLLDF